MATSDDFVDAVAACSDALASLNTKAQALYYAATDPTEQGIAEQAMRFATKAGPAGLMKAVATGDAHFLLNVQHGLAGVTEDVSDELVTDLVERFLLFAVNPLLALAPASVLGEAKEALQSVPLPDPPQEQPVWLWAGGGAMVGGLAALTLTGQPRAILAGAIGGGALGLLGRYALGKLAAKFTL